MIKHSCASWDWRLEKQSVPECATKEDLGRRQAAVTFWRVADLEDGPSDCVSIELAIAVDIVPQEAFHRFNCHFSPPI